MIYDVNNLNSLQKYQKINQEIKTILTEESENSIQTLFYSLNWDDTVYRTFNKGLALMFKYNNQDKLPGTLIEYIHKAHVALILSTLRKMFEPPKSGKYSVNSIPTIINTISANIGLWTRENYVCYDGIPYTLNSSSDWRTNMIIKDRHDKFDNMCDNNGHRHRDDKLSRSIIDTFKKTVFLDPIIDNFANNFLFHAGSINTRPNDNDIFSKTTLLRIQNQMKKSIWITHQIGKIVDQLVLTELATPQFDQLKCWGSSIFNDKIVNQLYKYWDERVIWWKKWTYIYWNSNEIYISLKKKYR